VGAEYFDTFSAKVRTVCYSLILDFWIVVSQSAAIIKATKRILQILGLCALLPSTLKDRTIMEKQPLGTQ
jgi:hypothetical protein